MIFWEIAKRNLRIHLLRSFLAMLGIVIGVVAIASMGILGNSMVLSVSDSLRHRWRQCDRYPLCRRRRIRTGGWRGPVGKPEDHGPAVPADKTGCCTQHCNSRPPDRGTYENRCWQR